MRVVVFRHVPFEDLGLIRPVLEQRGISVEFGDLYREGAPFPDLSHAAGLILMGGPMSANDDLPYLQRELEAIEEAVERGQPVLGICLGAQLIAKALGARVHRNPAKEIGWFDIYPSQSAREDPLFRELNDHETVFHWHGETFDLPASATWLAYSDRCRNQAFRHGLTTYGLQFHLEVTPEMIADWCQQDANCGDIRELDAPVDPYRNSKRLSELARLVFGRWCELLN